MLLCSSSDGVRQPCLFRVVTAHKPLKFREFIDHLGGQISLRHTSGLGHFIGISPNNRRDLACECDDTVNPLFLAAQLVVERHVRQAIKPRVHARFCHPQIVLPEEFRIRQTCKQHLLIALQNRRPMIRRHRVRHSHKALDLARLGVADGEEFLVLFHRGFQHLGRQPVKRRIDLTDQHNRPFDQPCNLTQQALILDHLKPQREGLVCGIIPDHFGPLVSAQHHMRALELRLVILERVYRNHVRAQETVTARLLASLDSVHVHWHNFGTCLVGQNTDDRMQRTDPFQGTCAPAHRLWPREIADSVFQNFGDDIRGQTARLFDHGKVGLTLLVVADFQRVTRHPSPTQKALNRLLRRADFWALTLFAHRFALGRQILNRQRQSTRCGKRSRRLIGQTCFDQTVSHQLLQISRRFALHPRRNFLGEKFNQEIRHQFRPSGAGGHSGGVGLPSNTTSPQKLIWCHAKARPSG